MNIRKLLMVAAACVPFLAAGGGALANDKAKKQAEIREKMQKTLNDFYAADANVKGEVEKGAGYAVFTTYGLSFLIGGAGGSGLAHNNKTNKDTFMSLAQGSAGAQIGASDTRYLFVFSDAKALQQFIDKGWTAGGQAAAGAGVGGDNTANVGAGQGEFNGGGKMYLLTKAGLQAGGAAQGTKVWKDKKLN
jgi:lipid-binding SYLF domain-containing protein